MCDGFVFDPEIERLDEINANLKLIQRKNGLTFGTDAYILSAFAKSSPRGKAADFGCGN
jgi:tRNA1(Val) A37 N6-methylase TrmN6